MLLVSVVGECVRFLSLIIRLYDKIPSASGFTTRSDIGPAREGPSAEAIACVSLLFLDFVILNGLLRIPGRHRPDVVRSLTSILSNFKTQIMNTASLRVRHTNKTMKKQTGYTIRSTRIWTRGDGHAGVCFPVRLYPRSCLVELQ